MPTFPATLTTEPCQCEHRAHFFETHGPRPHTPNGNPGHAYGARYVPSYMTDLLTVFGKFRVCKDCLDDCWAPRLKEVTHDANPSLPDPTTPRTTQRTD